MRFNESLESNIIIISDKYLVDSIEKKKKWTHVFKSIIFVFDVAKQLIGFKDIAHIYVSDYTAINLRESSF